MVPSSLPDLQNHANWGATMCGRADIHKIRWAFFDVSDPEPGVFQPGYNVAPTDIVPMIRRGVRGGREAGVAVWDLSPPWRTGARKAPLHNARSETVHRLPSFRSAFQSRRCIVPANGYFEWRRTDRQPFYFCRGDGNPLAFAGIYEQAADGSHSTCILTTSPNRECSAIHDRMPVILRRRHWDRWLEPDALAESERLAMLVPAPDASIRLWPVGRAVGNVRNDHPGLIEPLAIPVEKSEPGSQSDFFDVLDS
jgi:putative SOS response-associated peptidase YedK